MKDKKKILMIVVCGLIFVALMIFGYTLGKSLNDNSSDGKSVETEKNNKEEKNEDETPEEEIPEEVKEKHEAETKTEETEKEKVPVKKVVDVEQVIKEYDLESIRDYINKVKGLFKEYAEAVLNNEKITYPKQMLMMYKVIVSNKDFMEKEYFLNNVRNLMFEELAANDAIARYYDGYLKVVVNGKIKEGIFYHELMHFIDRRLATERTYFCYDNKQVSYNFTTCKDLYDFSTNYRFLTEAGAEVNTLRYFSKFSNGYSQINNIYSLLSYVIGEQKMNDIYYSGSNFGELYKELSKYQISIEEYIEFLSDATYLSYEENFIGNMNEKKKESDVLIEVLDFISKVYNNKNGHGWENDKEFVFLMKFTFYHSPLNYDHVIYNEVYEKLANTTNISSEEKKALKNEIDFAAIRNQIKDIKIINVNNYNFIINNGKIYILMSTRVNGKVEDVFVEYDVNSEKVKSYYME